MTSSIFTIVLFLGLDEIFGMDVQTLLEPGRLTETLNNPSLSDEELANIGNECIEIAKYEQALEFYNKAIEKSSSKKASHFRQRGKCHLKLRKWDAAILDYRQAVELEPDDEEGLSDLKQAVASKDCYEAISNTSLSNMNEAQLFHIGKRCSEANALPEALCCYTAAIEINPKRDYYVQRGNCYRRLRKFGEAESDFRTILDKNPDDKKVRRALSYVLVHKGEPDQAIKEMLRSNCDHENLKSLGDAIVLINKEYVHAFRCYTEALKKCPPEVSVAPYIRKRNFCSSAIKKLETPIAIRDFRRILELESDNVVIRMDLVEMLMKSKQYTEAIEVSQKLEETQILEIGVDFMNNCNNFEAAAVCFSEFINRSHGNVSPSVYMNRGICYRELGISEKAIADFRNSLCISRENWSAQAHLCEELIVANQLDEAKKVAQFVEENIPQYEMYSETRKRIKEAKQKIQSTIQSHPAEKTQGMEIEPISEDHEKASSANN